MMMFPRSGLYAITQTVGKMPEQVLIAVEAALRGGATAIQYRDKQPHDALALALALQRLCQQYDVPLLINDNAALAARVGAAGVHLGKDDGGIEAARRQLGKAAIIGVSCYNSVETAINMAAQGADYVAFGRFFPSNSKPLAAPAPLETLTLAKQQLTLPIVAIGGVLPSNGKALLDAGADVLAVIGGVFDATDPERAALGYRGLFGG